MKITKKFKVESAHIVRNATSYKCALSIHGHSALIELTLSGTELDKGQMLYDFGNMKSTIKEFIESMDHCTMFWDKDDPDYIEFIKKYSARWISMPFNPTAEMLSVFIMKYCQYILDHTNKKNGECNIKVESVRYHETATGCAECNVDDMCFWGLNWMDRCKFSFGVINEWSKDLKGIIFDHKNSDNSEPQHQID